MEVALAAVLVVAAMVPLAIPYALPGHQLAHDRLVPYMRVDALYRAILEGQIPPRWFPDFDGGYGSPYPSFYAMLFYYPATALYGLGVALGSAVELTAFGVLVLSGLTMFMFVSRYWGPASGLLAAVLYVYAPYHLADAFERGAHSELAAFVWLPLIALSYLACFETDDNRWPILGAIATAGLLLTHNLTSLIFLPPLAALLIAQTIGRNMRPDELKRGLRRLTFAAGIGLSLSAFFWVPVVLERQFVHLEHFLRFDYRGDFVPVRWLFWLPSSVQLETTAGLALGVIPLAALVLAFVRRAERKRVCLLVGLVLLGWFNLFMTTRYSSFLWRSIEPLPFVQFPWRFLSPASFYLAAAAGSFAALSGAPRKRWLVAAGLGLIAVFSTASQAKMSNRTSVRSIEPTDLCREVWLTQDYRPVWSQAALWTGADPPSDPQLGPVLPPCPESLFQSDRDLAEVIDVRRDGLRWTIEYQATKLTTMSVAQFYFPGWRVTIDGEPTKVSPQQPEGLIEITVPKGRHTVNLEFVETPVRRAANFVSLVGVGASLWLAFRSRL